MTLDVSDTSMAVVLKTRHCVVVVGLQCEHEFQEVNGLG
jgi:hypothetical protein